jgi:hypothetical protein
MTSSTPPYRDRVGPGITLLLLAFAVAIFAAFAIDAALAVGASGEQRAFAAALTLAALGLSTCGVASLMRRTLVVDEVLVRRDLFGSRSIAFADVVSIAAHSDLMQLRGDILIPLQSLSVRGPAGSAIHITFRDGDHASALAAGLQRLIDVIAARLQVELDRTGKVRWTPAVHLTKSGLMPLDGGVERPERHIPFTAVHRTLQLPNTMLFFAGDDENPALRIDKDAQNFLPGLRLYARLTAKSAA